MIDSLCDVINSNTISYVYFYIKIVKKYEDAGRFFILGNIFNLLCVIVRSIIHYYHDYCISF